MRVLFKNPLPTPAFRLPKINVKSKRFFCLESYEGLHIPTFFYLPICTVRLRHCTFVKILNVQRLSNNPYNQRGAESAAHLLPFQISTIGLRNSEQQKRAKNCSERVPPMHLLQRYLTKYKVKIQSCSTLQRINLGRPIKGLFFFFQIGSRQQSDFGRILLSSKVYLNL